MSFSLTTDDAALSWDAGRVDGYPGDLVVDADIALRLLDAPVGGTPTGPWYAPETPEAAFLTLSRLLPRAEVGGDPPVFEQMPDELGDDEPISEAVDYREVLHPRDRRGQWRDKPGIVGAAKKIERWWHVTNEPDFHVDPNYPVYHGPSKLLGPQEETRGILFVTKHPEVWVTATDRDYIAEIEVPADAIKYRGKNDEEAYIDAAQARSVRTTPASKFPGVGDGMVVSVDPPRMEFPGTQPTVEEAQAAMHALPQGVDREVSGAAIRLYEAALWRAEKDTAWQQGTQDEYAPFPYFKEDLPWQESATYHVRKRVWNNSIRRALSLNRITPKEAEERGWHSSGHDSPSSIYVGGVSAGGWQELPSPLYHVTTAASKVRTEGLKTRDELAQERGMGLGGGEDDTISFTTNLVLASDIERALKEMRRVAAGETTVEDLLQAAREGRGADRPYLSDIMRQFGVNDWKEGDPYPTALQDVLDRVKRGSGFPVTLDEARTELGPEWRLASNAGPGTDVPKGTMWSRSAFVRDMTPEEATGAAIDLFRQWLAWRSHAGGPEDPVFFMSNSEALASVPEREIAAMEFRPKPGARGYPLGGMNEWRTAAGEAVELAA